MVNCKKASELVSKKIDSQKLSWFEKISLKFHVLICSACAMFETETEVISDCMKNKTKDIPSLSDDKKDAFQKAINAHQ